MPCPSILASRGYFFFQQPSQYGPNCWVYFFIFQPNWRKWYVLMMIKVANICLVLHPSILASYGLMYIQWPSKIIQETFYRDQVIELMRNMLTIKLHILCFVSWCLCHHGVGGRRFPHSPIFHDKFRPRFSITTSRPQWLTYFLHFPFHFKNRFNNSWWIVAHLKLQ